MATWTLAEPSQVSAGKNTGGNFGEKSDESKLEHSQIHMSGAKFELVMRIVQYVCTTFHGTWMQGVEYPSFPYASLQAFRLWGATICYNWEYLQ